MKHLRLSFLIFGLFTLVVAGCPNPSFAQCTGSFGANQVCGSVSGGIPGPFSISSFTFNGLTLGNGSNGLFFKNNIGANDGEIFESSTNNLTFNIGGSAAGFINGSQQWMIGGATAPPSGINLTVSANVASAPTLAFAGETILTRFIGKDGNLAGVTIDAFGNVAAIGLTSTGGTAASPTATTAGLAGAYDVHGYFTSGVGSPAYSGGFVQLRGVADDSPFTATAQGGHWEIDATPIGSTAANHIAVATVNATSTTAGNITIGVASTISGSLILANSASANLLALTSTGSGVVVNQVSGGGTATLTIGAAGGNPGQLIIASPVTNAMTLVPASSATGTATIPSGTYTFAGLSLNQTFSGINTFTGAINTTPAGGQASFGASATQGAQLIGNGSSNDFLLANALNNTICNSPHNSQTLSCSTITATSTISATGGFIANGNTGLTQTCTVNQAKTLIFTLGILTGGTCNT